MNKDIFVFVIAYNCGIIVNKCLESYHKHHDEPIHIFGKAGDLKDIYEHENNILIDMSSDETLENLYKQGHMGTAYMWAKVINGDYGDYSKVIQIDSDVIFINECLSDVTNAFNEGYNLIGARRSYKSIPNLQDVVSTFFIGVDIKKITKRPFNEMHRMCAGIYNPAKHKIIDFFDPVSFDIIYNGGKVKYLNFKEYGSCDENGSFDNGHLIMNELYDYGEKIIHFAGIGSGMNFYNNGDGDVPPTYTSWAKKRFSMYMKLFYNRDIDIEYNLNDYEITKKYLQ